MEGFYTDAASNDIGAAIGWYRHQTKTMQRSTLSKYGTTDEIELAAILMIVQDILSGLTGDSPRDFHTYTDSLECIRDLPDMHATSQPSRNALSHCKKI